MLCSRSSSITPSLFLGGRSILAPGVARAKGAYLVSLLRYILVRDFVWWSNDYWDCLFRCFGLRHIRFFGWRRADIISGFLQWGYCCGSKHQVLPLSLVLFSCLLTWISISCAFVHRSLNPSKVYGVSGLERSYMKLLTHMRPVLIGWTFVEIRI